jgi:hypothetical protein
MTRLPIHPDHDGPHDPQGPGPDAPDPELERLRLAERISDWLDRLDLEDEARTTLATGLAGALGAAEEARQLLDAVLATDPTRDGGDAAHALDLATELTGQLAGELRARLADVERAWPALEDRLLELAPEHDEDETDGNGDA